MPIESYELIDGRRIDMPTGDTPPGASGQADGPAANGTGVLAATEGEASPAATESSAPQTPPPEGGEPVEEEADLPDEQATVPFVNRKIKRLNAQRLAMQRKMDEERHQHALELAQIRGQQEAVQRMLAGAAPELPQTPAQPTVPPQAEQFERHEEFIQAAANYAADQRFQQQRQVESQAAFQQSLMAREQAFKQAHPDFDTVVRSGLAGRVSPVLQQALMLVPDGPAVAYTLAQQPELVQRLNALPPPLVLVELGRLSPGPQPTTPTPAVGSSNGNGAGVSNAAPPSQTTLHAPETPLSGSGGGAPTASYRDDMSAAEFAAWRKRTSQLAAWKERG